jgi:hypothetical protein
MSALRAMLFWKGNCGNIDRLDMVHARVGVHHLPNTKIPLRRIRNEHCTSIAWPTNRTFRGSLLWLHWYPSLIGQGSLFTAGGVRSRSNILQSDVSNKPW